MIHEDIAGVSFTHLSGLGLDPSDLPDQFSFADTIKNTLSDGVVSKAIVSCTSTELEMSVAKSDYLSAVLTELHFGKVRIAEQCLSLSALIEAGAHPAWILVTAYYACYFISNDIAKGSGTFIMNFSEDEFRGILADEPPSIRNAMIVDKSTPFYVVASHGDMSGEVNLLFRKHGGKPHQLAWNSFHRLLNKISVNDSRIKYLELMKQIAKGSDGWCNPSDIRNTWNYIKSNYYGDKGRDLAKNFTSIIRSRGSAHAWAGSVTLKPTEQNIPASVAYLYHSLCRAHDVLVSRLKI
ncbi:hypothetical protein [Janthinobacterium sp. PC23-8]|uniref:hypothetical protein n=1 Tax=Janthinobacterium sp. PC23-8 TaxID=2012679 RepID=UPI00114050BB|nr:hypothetical protein [Janthinobacterium sp. PC23-8]